jgi:hypothetical protein
MFIRRVWRNGVCCCDAVLLEGKEGGGMGVVGTLIGWRSSAFPKQLIKPGSTPMISAWPRSPYLPDWRPFNSINWAVCKSRSPAVQSELPPFRSGSQLLSLFSRLFPSNPVSNPVIHRRTTALSTCLPQLETGYQVTSYSSTTIPKVSLLSSLFFRFYFIRIRYIAVLPRLVTLYPALSRECSSKSSADCVVAAASHMLIICPDTSSFWERMDRHFCSSHNDIQKLSTQRSHPKLVLNAVHAIKRYR